MRSLLLAAAALLILPSIGYSHPHVFIDARLQVVANSDGNVVEFRNVWRFDELFSSSVLMDFDRNADLTLDAAERQAIAAKVTASLSKDNFFTNVIDNGRMIAVSKPATMEIGYGDGVLELQFAVKPTTKVPLKGRMVFGVYDRTLYTAISFATDAHMQVIGPGVKTCTSKVVRPDADQIMAENQAYLTDMFFYDPTGTNMQAITATRLELTCP